MRLSLCTALCCLGTGLPLAGWAEDVSPAAPAVECHSAIPRVSKQEEWPGYLDRTEGSETCIPFTPTGLLPPAGYAGDFYVDEFTDAKIRKAWADCKAQGAACLDSEMAVIEGQGGENVFRNTGSVDPNGRIDPLAGNIDLTQVRRPAYFGQPPYNEPIAAVEGRTYTVEVTVASEPNEHKYMDVPEDQTWRLRGWYIEGDGVENAEGRVQRALIVLVAGRTIETTAMQHPDDMPYTRDAATGEYVDVTFPTERSEKWGTPAWRGYILALNEAGFDVLTLDKRGHGISGGRQASNNALMARDLFAALEEFDSGAGLRLVNPAGDVLAGPDAAGILLGGQKSSEIPLIFAGPSQGAMVVAFAMHDALVGDCSFDAVETVCGPKRDVNVKAGMLLAEFAKGPGYAPARAIREGAFRSDYDIAYLPTSEIMQHIGEWPATFIGRGLWDVAGGLEGTLDLYRRAGAPKELVVVRGPHSEVEYGEPNIKFMQQRMVAFATAVMKGNKTIPGAATFSDLRELVLSAPADWAPTSDPADR
ncbi:lysophospholipase [Paracoccus aurantiacus]|uniref:Lysophospholipase n=1 Tax=Paracoccus aurantiacus TaxID=2599412 RepID=A0A5C6S4I9_9RHOB|nr:alpha/beta hydrolase [Paracoccus aurantiacus]TXB69365.1 lysophospholipase [Paracoccus aurantiacus]